jgi:hypothetical protein
MGVPIARKLRRRTKHVVNNGRKSILVKQGKGFEVHLDSFAMDKCPGRELGGVSWFI